METANYHISLDVQEGRAGALLEMKQHDTRRRVYISLTDGGRPYRIKEDCYGVFTAKKPDGTAIFNDCTLEGNTLIYDVTPQTTADCGELACEVRLYGSDEALLTSAAFGILVYPAVVSEADAAASAGETTVLTRLMGEVAQIKDNQSTLFDDASVGGAGWSSRRIIDTLCPAFSETGGVVSCRPVEGYPLTVAAEGAVTHLGKNRILQPYNRGTTAANGMTFTVNADYSVTLDTDGDATTGLATFVLLGKGVGTSAQSLSRIGLSEGQTCTLSLGCELPEGIAALIFFYKENGSAVTSSTISAGTDKKTFTVPAGAEWIYVYLRVNMGTAVSGLTLYPMIEKGETATAYEPYKAQQVQPGTVTAWAGENTFFAEEGQVTVTGRKDIITILEGI